MAASERDVVGLFRLGRLGGRASAEHAHLKRHDLGAGPLSAAVLRLVLAGGEAAFDVDLAAFAQKPLAVVGELSECNHAMPFGPLLLVAVSILKLCGRRQR